MTKYQFLPTIFVILGAISLCHYAYAASSTTIAVGQKAPDFTLLDETSTPRTLSALRGSRVALSFYPTDQLPNCTAQACSIRDSMAELAEQGIHVWGINDSSPKAHAKIKEKHHLSFPLLSDSDKKVAALYNAKGWFFIDRTTILIDEHGIIVAIITNVDVAHHAEQILEEFKKVGCR